MAPSSTVTDVLVLGGGVVGIATALALAERGQRALLVERFEAGHDHGSSHGDGRIFRFSYPDAIYLDMAAQAKAGWLRLQEQAGEELLVLCGNWDAGPAGCEELVEIEANLTRAGLPCQHLTAGESNARFPRLRLPAGSEALFQPDGGLLRADQALAALWRLARRAGVECVTGEAVTGIDGGDAEVTVATAGGRRHTARRLVLAAGAWSRELAAGLGLDLPLTVTQEQVAYFRPREGVGHGPEVLPTFIDYHRSHHVYGLPQLSVPGVKVGLHHAGRALADPDQRQPTDPDNLAAVSAFVRDRLPHLSPEPFQVTTCLYTTTPDRHFLLDRHPTLPRVVLATGGSGHGFKFAPVLGEIAAALALDEEPPVALETFALARFGERLGVAD